MVVEASFLCQSRRDVLLEVPSILHVDNRIVGVLPSSASFIHCTAWQNLGEWTPDRQILNLQRFIKVSLAIASFPGPENQNLSDCSSAQWQVGEATNLLESVLGPVACEQNAVCRNALLALSLIDDQESCWYEPSL